MDRSILMVICRIGAWRRSWRCWWCSWAPCALSRLRLYALLLSALSFPCSSHPAVDACFDASFSIACLHLAMLMYFPCRFKLPRIRNVPPKAESVGGEHASLASCMKPRLRRLRPIRACTAGIPPSLQLATQLFIRIGRLDPRARPNGGVFWIPLITASTDQFCCVDPHECCKVHTGPWNVS